MEGIFQFLHELLECVPLALRFDDAVENTCARQITMSYYPDTEAELCWI